MFNKNLEFITNIELKQRLRNLNIEETRLDISYCMTPTNDYLLMKNDIPIDDINDPRGAVRNMFQKNIKQPMGPNDIIITFGIGLGYLLDETFNTYSSRIFVYEPDIKLLHFVLNNIDISEHLSSGRVFIYDNLDELMNKLSSIYITKDKVEVLYLQNYAIVKNQELLLLTQKVYETCKSKMVDVNTITRYAKVWVANTVKNINTINSSTFYKLSDLEGKFAGQTALVIAAGPSLSENIEKIKADRNKFVIFAVNKVLRTLLANGIYPDFVVGLDAQYVGTTFNGLEEYLPKINYITDIRSDNSALTMNFKKTFIAFTENDLVIKKMKEFNDIHTYESGGSATTMAFVTAVKLGFNKIIFTGLDLAYKGDVAYASGDSVNKISENQIVINGIVKNISTVKSVTGQDAWTTDDYAAFIKHFETLIREFGFSEVYNTTSFGAAINGMKNVKFEEIPLLNISNTTSIITGEAKPCTIETKEWTQEELQLINNVIALLAKNNFSPALVSSIVKSPLLYQYMQKEILQVLQSSVDEGIAGEFMENAKISIKEVIDLLQKNRLI